MILRAVLFALVALIGSAGTCQLTFMGDKVVLDSVVQVDTTAYTVLYERAREWMLRNLKSSDSQILLDDSTRVRLIGTANLLLPSKNGPDKSIHTDRVLNFKLSLSFKDGLYRVICENIVYSYRFVRGSSAFQIRNTAEELFLYLKTAENKGRRKSIDVAREPIAEMDLAIAGMLKALDATVRGESGLINGDW